MISLAPKLSIDTLPRFLRVKALALALLVVGHSVPAKALQKAGHEEKTKEAAQKLGFSQAAIAVFMRGAARPDFDNYDNASAHAQTTNDDEGKPTETKEQAEANCAQYLLDKGSKFHEQLQAGRIEAALYVLGYSIHTIQDFAAHQGMSNAEHSLLSYAQQQNPDTDPANIAKAEKWTEDFLSRVHVALGDGIWNQLVTYQPTASQPPSQSEQDERWTVYSSGATPLHVPMDSGDPLLEITDETQATAPSHPDLDANTVTLGRFYWDYYYVSYNGEWRPEYRIRWGDRDEELENVKTTLIEAFVRGFPPSSLPQPPTGLQASVQ